MSEINIFGWKTEQHLFDITEKFDVDESDDEIVYFSKETFEHTEDGPKYRFKYKYAIKAEQMWWVEDDPAEQEKWLVELFFVVDPKCATKEIRDFLGDGCGFRDMLDNGYSVRFGSEKVDTQDEVGEKMLHIANIFEVMDRLRDFSLDKYVNMIGNTGWDWIWEITKGEDMFKALQKRMKKQKV